MGCSANIHIEVKKDGSWHHYHAPRVERDYRLFALMGETRRVPGMKAVEGALSCGNVMPDDASVITKACFDYGHDITVLNSDAIVKLQDKLYVLHPEVERTGIDELDLEYSLFRTYVNGNTIAGHTGFEDSRIIVWFEG